MFKDTNDISQGLVTLGFGALMGLIVSPFIAFVIYVGTAIYFCYTGIAILISAGAEKLPTSRDKNPKQNRILPTTSATVITTPTIAEKLASTNIPRDLKCPSCGANIRPTDKKCNYCGSSLIPLIDLPEPANFGDVQVGQSIRVAHPEEGSLTLTVQERLYYGELWQKKMRSDVPWTLTGNYYVGLMLDQDLFLLNWQSRFYLLDSHGPITDMDINRDFAPYARQFASSNQTADVYFKYQGTKWHIDDIGRFRIEYSDGDKPRVSPGAVGRFIHASDKDQVLVVEDYQSGGSGLDILWQGFLINEKDIGF